MSRFVILEHDHPQLHWDLMLEAGERLRTWRLDEMPCGQAVVPAQAIAEHRVAYLDYEGPVSGGRGSVRRREAGLYHLEEERNDKLELRLQGSSLVGRAVLLRLDGDRWEFHWLADS
jgi:hypothetical protein